MLNSILNILNLEKSDAVELAKSLYFIPVGFIIPLVLSFFLHMFGFYIAFSIMMLTLVFAFMWAIIAKFNGYGGIIKPFKENSELAKNSIFKCLCFFSYTIGSLVGVFPGIIVAT